eukprot:16243798-Heterocapsa_arctica.AAC.1
MKLLLLVQGLRPLTLPYLTEALPLTHLATFWDDRAAVVPAWENVKRIIYNNAGCNRYGAGATDLSTLLDHMWPAGTGVGRFGLPDDFGPPHPQDEAFMDP